MKKGGEATRTAKSPCKVPVLPCLCLPTRFTFRRMPPCCSSHAGNTICETTQPLARSATATVCAHESFLSLPRSFSSNVPLSISRDFGVCLALRFSYCASASVHAQGYYRLCPMFLHDSLSTVACEWISVAKSSTTATLFEYR